MFCSKCGAQMSTKSRFCSRCGQRTKRASKLLIISTIFMALICITVFIFLGGQLKQLPKQEVATEVVKKESKEEPKEEKVEQTKVEPEKEVATKKQELVETPKDVSEIINTSQPKVFTIFTDLGQGSGFLINTKGDVLTNAHVVEGSLKPIVKTMDGKELQGTLIGYSNTTDIAVIRVPDLANKEPLSLEDTPAEIGDEVIALGSPQGFENTATLGNISGVDRTFVIDPFYYEGIYQTSAPIAPGSSGGPLLNKETGKVIAINSARHTQEVNIGFSIPIYKIAETINQWIDTPMIGDEISSLFYYQDGVYYYQDYLDEPGYFEGGDYNEDYFEYYELPYDESWYEDYYDYWSDNYEDDGSDELDEFDEYEDGGSYETDEYGNYEGYGSYESDEYDTYEDYGSYEEDEDYYQDDYGHNESNENDGYGDSYSGSGYYEDNLDEEEYVEEGTVVEEPIESREPEVVDPSDPVSEHPVDEGGTTGEEVPIP